MDYVTSANSCVIRRTTVSAAFLCTLICARVVAQSTPANSPITGAGGVVKNGPVIFQNVPTRARLTSWHNHTGAPQKRLIIEAKGSGVCSIDFDQDGWLDIYLVNGSTMEALNGKEPSPHAAIFRDNHDGTVEKWPPPAVYRIYTVVEGKGISIFQSSP